ncbi:MAG TPA: hypothetical protein VFD01_04870, partial [Candidatus Dormibacteraeota bacterium]|nr:hypothetical protein [Candidatus Dormibacteraeota bacterium]
YETARRILTERRTAMDAVVRRLEVEETIDAAQLDQILADPDLDSTARRPMHALTVGAGAPPP